MSQQTASGQDRIEDFITTVRGKPAVDTTRPAAGETAPLLTPGEYRLSGIPVIIQPDGRVQYVELHKRATVLNAKRSDLELIVEAALKARYRQRAAAFDRLLGITGRTA